MKLHRPRTYYRMLMRTVLRDRNRYHEPEVMKVAKRIRGRVFVDIGANIGLYTIPLSKNFRTVHAIEPNPEALSALEMHTRKNPRITVLPLALSDRNGETMLYLDRTQGRCSGSADTILPIFEYKPPSNPTVNRSTWEHEGIMVETMRYDNLFPGYVDLVKIDVEGAEFLVLKGMESSLKDGRIANLLIELHNRDRAKELENLMAEHGYSHRWLDADHLYAQA